MMSGVHAMVGAAVGSLARSRGLAFLAGVGTHVVGDLLPHQDHGLATELPLVAGALWWVGARQGWDSPAFWGALGGAAPDLENALDRLGLGNGRGLVFPTHGSWHGRRSGELTSQAALALLCWAALQRRGTRDVDRGQAPS